MQPNVPELFPDDELVEKTYGREDVTPLTGNCNYGQCAWGEGRDLSHLEGRKMRLRFLLRQGELYSFKAAGPAQ